MTIERNFDIGFVAGLALREKQIQQNYRPIISVHKWFARRPGTLFRGLMLSEFLDEPVEKAFFRAHDLGHLTIADPFMGGGIPLIEANRLGCDVVGTDINPMAYWIVQQEIEHLDLDAYRAAATKLLEELATEIGPLYETKCCECGNERALVKYFLWVKVRNCSKCSKDFDLFPGYLVAQNRRHPKNVIFCPHCRSLNEVEDRAEPGDCGDCGSPLRLSGPAKRSRCTCPHCGEENRYPVPSQGPPQHRMFALEYHCPECRPMHKGRYFKIPDDSDLARERQALEQWRHINSRYVPDEEIPRGDEADRLHRWGYRQYREMFNARQLLGLEKSARIIGDQRKSRVRNALATNLSDLLRYQNMLCRYDTMALKSLDIFSIHGFPVGLVQCESNFIGIAKAGGGNIGSGGWTNIIDKYVKAKTYCDHPFEVTYDGKKKIKIPIHDEWIGDRRNGKSSNGSRRVDIRCQSATSLDLPAKSLDGVFTDPPYLGNVQYAELMDFCYVWLRRLIGKECVEFRKNSTRSQDELTANRTLERGLDHFVEGLAAIFQDMAAALKPGSPLVFTYHHNKIDAYYAVAVAILDAGLVCSASLPCPAEMAASIHIRGTASSVVDTVFVARSTGSVPTKWICASPTELAELVRDDLAKLRDGNLKPTRGDIRCIVFGHLTRLAIWRLRHDWKADHSTTEKLSLVAAYIEEFGGLESVERNLNDDFADFPLLRRASLGEEAAKYGDDEISF